MTKEKFSELVNLYLDEEISSEDLELLKAELRSNPERKAEFQERSRLHQAMRLAMGAQPADVRRFSCGSNSTQSSGLAGLPSDREGSKMSTSKDGSQFPRWISGFGLAACLTISGVLLYPVFTDTTNTSKQVGEAEFKDAVDPLIIVERSDLNRFASNQQRQERRSSSLAAELRLLGLHPEVMDREAELREVSLASIQPRDVSQRRIEMFNQLKEYTPLPEPKILEVAEPRRRSTQWPAGFQSSLASFK